MANKIIPFRRWRPLLFAILSLAMICTTGLVLFVIRPPDMSWLKEGGMWLFFVAMFWFFYHNVRLIWRSYRRNIGLEIDAEGMTAYTLRPAINTKVYWNDIENIAVVEQSLFLSSIEQLHIRVPFVAPYIEAESALAKWARNRQHGTNRPITLVINVQELAITPTKLKDLIDEYLTSH